MQPKATNNFILLKRDEVEKEKGGLIIPGIGQVRQSCGTILSIGKLVKDADIRAGKGKKCLFHPTVGFTITYEEIEYLVLTGEEIIMMV